MKIIVGISGASCTALGYEMLKALQSQQGVEIHLVMTESAIRTMSIETSLSTEDFLCLADCAYPNTDMGALISSGSFRTDGMVVIPCSMKTLSAIAHGYNSHLIVRAADVCLKEGRKVVLVPREMPLNCVHLNNMSLAAKAGCVMIPPMLTLYNHADTVQKQIDHIIGKVLMQFNLESERFVPWSDVNEQA
jgi:4-hydroxy-3-polyprenylbenzoate decarboxylase